MADHPTEPQIVAILKLALPYVPGFAGAVLALSFLDRLTARGRLLALAVGLASAAFLGPALSAVADLFWPGALPPAVDSAIKFLAGLLGMGCLPPFLRWAAKAAGDPPALLSLLKIQIGPGASPSVPPQGTNPEVMP